MANCQCPECSCTAYVPDDADLVQCSPCLDDDHAQTPREA